MVKLWNEPFRVSNIKWSDSVTLAIVDAHLPWWECLIESFPLSNEILTFYDFI